MEENLKNKLERIQEMEDGFKDFDDSEAPISSEDIELAEANLQEQLKALAKNPDEASMFHEFKSSETEEKENLESIEAEENTTPQEDITEENSQEEAAQEEKEAITVQSPWEEYANKEEDSAVKKYLFYVSKDFVPFIDNLTTDERTAYINDAIQKKIDAENQQHRKESNNKIITHFVVMILTIIIMTPLALLGVHKAIMATFENYKYSQENFEKLYKSRFEKDRAYMRSVQYNKEQEQKKINK